MARLTKGQYAKGKGGRWLQWSGVKWEATEYSVTEPLIRFSVEAWVHPKSGGDDCVWSFTFFGFSEAEAKRKTERWLKRRSAITTDYRIIGREVVN